MRALLPMTLLLSTLASAQIATFEGGDQVRWQTVNDGVMGGVSQGDWQMTDRGTLLFAGETSLRNNGGFSSIRTRPRNLELEGFDGVAIRVKGDGRTYKLSLRTSRASSWVAYWADFETNPGEWQEVRIPFGQWIPTFMGQRLDGPALDVSAINSVGFMMYDKKAGPFSLEVDWIRGYREGDEPAPAAAATGNLVEVATDAGAFETLLAAASTAGVAEALAASGPYTILAPTDEAFAALPMGSVRGLLEPANRFTLLRLLQHHIVVGDLSAGALEERGKVVTLAGTELSITRIGGATQVDGVPLVTADVPAENGRIHILGEVLLPFEQ